MNNHSLFDCGGIKRLEHISQYHNNESTRQINLILWNFSVVIVRGKDVDIVENRYDEAYRFAKRNNMNKEDMYDYLTYLLQNEEGVIHNQCIGVVGADRTESEE